jgi:hypothetical protein
MSRYFMLIIMVICCHMVVMAQKPYQMGTKYLNFEIEKMPFIGGGYFLQDELALEAGVGLAFIEEVNSNGLGLRLGLDKYQTGDRLSTFWGGYIKFEINPNALSQTNWKGSRLGLGGHLGLNLLILENFSVAGTLGGELFLNSEKDGDDSTNFSTFTSGLKARLFF